MILNKTRSATGGGPCKLVTYSPTETAVINLISLNDSVEGISGAKEFGDDIPENAEVFEYFLDDNAQSPERTRSSPAPGNESQSMTAPENESPSEPIHRHRRTALNTQRVLLEKQLKIQESVSSNLKHILQESKQKNRLLKKIYELEKDKLKDNRLHKLEKRKLMIQNFEIKNMKLDLEREKFEALR